MFGAIVVVCASQLLRDYYIPFTLGFSLGNITFSAFFVDALSPIQRMVTVALGNAFTGFVTLGSLLEHTELTFILFATTYAVCIGVVFALYVVVFGENTL